MNWWCAPEPDGPALLWSLLDPGGAAARWRGVRLAKRSQEPAGPGARTWLTNGDARFECWDALVEEGLVRLVRCLDGQLDISHELAVGGFQRAWGQWDDTAACRLVGPGCSVSVAGGHPYADGAWLVSQLRAPRGAWAVLTVGIDAVIPPDPAALAQRLANMEHDHATRLATARLPRHHPERAADALAVLEACTYGPTGAVMAAPTTSLPEAAGADRQFDYRYSWLRDASLGISVAALLGQRAAADRYLTFAVGLATPGAVPPAPVTDIRGGSVPAERDVPGVSGWAASVPVRVGNDAANQVQHDALGLLLEGISVHLQTGGRLDDRTWQLVRAVADHAATAKDGPTSGIWELRDPKDLLSADIGRWLALDRAIWISRGWRPWAPRADWKRARDDRRQRVLAALQPDGGLPQAYDDKRPVADASALMAVVFGMLDGRDPRAGRLVASTLDRLGAGAFLYRYEPGGDDGFAGIEGAFVPVCWWAVAALAAVGRVTDARARADELCALLPRLLAEEVDPASGESLGNVPLLWSHAEAARAMYLLDAASLRARFGSAALWAWRLARYARLRWPGPSVRTASPMPDTTASNDA